MLYAEILRIVPLWPVLPSVSARGIEGWDAFVRRLEQTFQRYTRYLRPSKHDELWGTLSEELEKARRDFLASLGKSSAEIAEAQQRMQVRLGAELRDAFEVILAELETEELVEALLERVDELLEVARQEPVGRASLDGKKDADSAETSTPDAGLDPVQLAERSIYAIGPEQVAPYERALMLSVIDAEWRQYLTAIDDLRQGIDRKS